MEVFVKVDVQTEDQPDGFGFRSRAPEETRRAARLLGRALAASAHGPAWVVALSGDLGAGKTLFVKGLAEGLGVEPASVSSPTFVIARQHPAAAGLALVHVDFYRLERGEEIEGIGFFDLLQPGSVVAVEWAERFPEALPKDRLELRLGHEAGGAASARRIDARAIGARAAEIVRRWRTAVDAADVGRPNR